MRHELFGIRGPVVDKSPTECAADTHRIRVYPQTLFLYVLFLFPFSS
jgi:hypothetical protein